MFCYSRDILSKWLKHISTLGFLLFIIIAFTILLKTFVSQQQQETRPQAAEGSRSDYYVSPSGSDSNDGSQAHPFATLQKAADKATPGTTVRVAPGLYTKPIISKVSGTANARITFLSEVKWGAKINVAHTGNLEEEWLNEGSYVTIEGFDIRGNGNEWSGINDWKGSFVQIIGNRIHDMSFSGCWPGAGILDESPAIHDNDIIGNVVFNIGPSTSCNLDHGIYHSDVGGHIWNNIVFSTAGWGIHCWSSIGAGAVANNLVFGNRRGGIIIGADPPKVADNFIVSNNIAVYNANYGIWETGSVGKNNKYYNNLVYGNASGGFSLQNSKDQGTITADPQFVNYQPDGSGDYHLKSTSPAIDAGTSICAPATDFDGNPRPQGKGVDIGPYEYHSSSLTSTGSSGNSFRYPVLCINGWKAVGPIY